MFLCDNRFPTLLNKLGFPYTTTSNSRIIWPSPFSCFLGCDTINEENRTGPPARPSYRAAMALADSLDIMPNVDAASLTETRIIVSLEPRRRIMVQGIRGQCVGKRTGMEGGISGSVWARTFVWRAPKHNSRFVSSSFTFTSLSCVSSTDQICQ